MKYRVLRTAFFNLEKKLNEISQEKEFKNYEVFSIVPETNGGIVSIVLVKKVEKRGAKNGTAE